MELVHFMVNFFREGGFFLYPLAAIFVIGVAITIERFIYLTNETTQNRRLWAQVVPLINSGNFKQVVAITSKSKASIATVLNYGIARLASARRRDDIGFCLREVLDRHAARNPAHADRNGDLGAQAGGQLAQVAHRERVHRVDVVFDGAAFLHRDTAEFGLQVEEARLDGGEVGRAFAHRAREQPAAEGAAMGADPGAQRRAGLRGVSHGQPVHLRPGGVYVGCYSGHRVIESSAGAETLIVACRRSQTFDTNPAR